MKIAYLLIGLGVVTTLSLVHGQLYAKPTPMVTSEVDIERYAGQWYEIARLPMFFQRHCASDVTANYQLNPDNTVQVLNQCINKKGEEEAAHGVAYAQNPAKNKLKVSFLPSALRWLPFTKGDYWILRLDPDYQVALVGGPSRKYLWLLSRSPTLDQATIDTYLQTARDQGFDTSKLIWTKQSVTPSSP
ncbi:lipocalin family protein [Acinetobacter puyangensis]|uniref:lipocalin family protein n=1 Tax=Acinetobacter puyangensis TaxID=1096779 RepID=UPI003A4D256F